MKKKTLVLDFDGVVHAYTSGWQGANIVADLPVVGAIDFIREAVKRFDVAIFSSRSSQPGGVEAMRDWLNFHGLPREWMDENLKFPTAKPPAWVTLDDRAIQFTGAFPPLDELEAFRTWAEIFPERVSGANDETRLASELIIMLMSRNVSVGEAIQALGKTIGVIIVNSAKSSADVASLTDHFTNRLEVFVSDTLLMPEVIEHFENLQ
jgi:hypothetical protein